MKRAVGNRISIPVAATQFVLKAGHCRFSTTLSHEGKVTALAIAPLKSIEPSSHAPMASIRWFGQRDKHQPVAVDPRHPHVAEFNGPVLPRAEMAATFLRSNPDALIVPETRDARDWLEAIVDTGSRAAVIIPLHEHTRPEFPATPNEIIGSLPPRLVHKLKLEIRFFPAPALISDPASSTARASQQFFRWAIAKCGEPGSSWAGPAFDRPLDGITVAIPRGAPNVNAAATCAMDLIEHAQVEQVCSFTSPRHTFVEVFGLDKDATHTAHSFPEARKDFLVEDLAWLYQSDEGWSFYFQRPLAFNAFASPSVFGKSFPVSNTHLRSRGILGLKVDEMLALVHHHNRGSANPVVAFVDHRNKRLHTIKKTPPTAVLQKTSEVAAVCGFPKHLPLSERADIIKQVIPSATLTECWLGSSPTRSELRGGCFFPPPTNLGDEHSRRGC